MTKVQELRNVETQVKQLLDELELKERIESTVESQLKELSNLYRISESLVTSGDIAATLDDICDSVSSVKDVDGVWVGLVGEDGGTIVPVASRKVPEQLLKPVRIDDVESPTAESVKLGKVTIIDSCLEPKRFAGWCEDASGTGYASAAMLPLIFGDTITGALVIFSCQFKFFVPQVLPLFQMYANQTSSAVKAAQQNEHVQLFQQKSDFHEKQYRLFLEQLPDAVFILNTDMECTYCNQLFEVITEKDIEKLVGKKIAQLFDKKDAGPIKSALTRCLEGANTAFSSRISRDARGLDILLRPIRSDDSTVVGIVGILRDVSERERTNRLACFTEELKSEITQQDWMIDDSPVGIMMIKPEGKITRLNPAASRLLGNPVGKCVNQPIYSLFPKKHSSSLASAIATALHSGGSKVESSVRINEEERYIDLKLCRRTRNNEYVLVVFLTEISEKVKIEDRLDSAVERLKTRGKDLQESLIQARRTEHELNYLKTVAGDLTEKLRSIREALAQSHDALLIVNAESGTIVEANKPAMKIFDYSESAFPNKGLKDLLAQDDNTDKTINRIINGTHSPFECSALMRENGDIFTGEIKSIPFRTAKARLLTVTIKDLSEQIRIQKQDELAEEQTERQLQDFKTETGDLKNKMMSLQEALSQSGDALLIVNAESGAILETNKPAMKLFDYSMPELSTKSLNDLLKHEDGSDEVVKKISNGTYHPFECSTLVRKNGEFFTGQVMSVSFQAADTKYLAVIIRDTSEQWRIRKQFEFMIKQIDIIEELFSDKTCYKSKEEYITHLMQEITPQFHLLGWHSLRIEIDGKAYFLEEDSVSGQGFSSTITIENEPRGMVDITVREGGVSNLDKDIMVEVSQRCMDLFSHAIGWMLERLDLRDSVAKNHIQIENMRKVIDRQQEMNDPLQAIQSSACLLAERSGGMNSTDRLRLNVIDEQISEVRKIIKDIASLAETVEKI